MTKFFPTQVLQIFGGKFKDVFFLHRINILFGVAQMPIMYSTLQKIGKCPPLCSWQIIHESDTRANTVELFPHVKTKWNIVEKDDSLRPLHTRCVFICVCVCLCV